MTAATTTTVISGERLTTWNRGRGSATAFGSGHSTRAEKRSRQCRRRKRSGERGAEERCRFGESRRIEASTRTSRELLMMRERACTTPFPRKSRTTRWRRARWATRSSGRLCSRRTSALATSAARFTRTTGCCARRTPSQTRARSTRSCRRAAGPATWSARCGCTRTCARRASTRTTPHSRRSSGSGSSKPSPRPRTAKRSPGSPGSTPTVRRTAAAAVSTSTTAPPWTCAG
mmetsp:Transcript_8783/g.28893  ORF Transcript_8783/g.28893 Transcript_8783/m.28893 type:complete len:232 (+) Transcript_8783:1893-2588(+)